MPTHHQQKATQYRFNKRQLKWYLRHLYVLLVLSVMGLLVYQLVNSLFIIVAFCPNYIMQCYHLKGKAVQPTVDFGQVLVIWWSGTVHSFGLGQMTRQTW